MEKERIRSNLGLLEEQLELLQSSINSNGIFLIGKKKKFDFQQEKILSEICQEFQNLQALVHEETLRQKSLPAEEFLLRVLKYFVREAKEFGFDISICHYGSGRISMEMVEISMGAIISCMRASLKSYRGMSRAHRLKHSLFLSYSFYIELCASTEEVYFRLLDDGQGYSGSLRAEFETEKYFRGIRSHIAKYGGWCNRKTFNDFGGLIEFKLPLQKSRYEAYLLKSGSFEVLLPSSCVSDIVELTSTSLSLNFTETKIRVDADLGLIEIDEMPKTGKAVKVGVADIQAWIFCDSLKSGLHIRSVSAADFLHRDSWFKNVGIYHELGISSALPLLEGSMILDRCVPGGPSL